MAFLGAFRTPTAKDTARILRELRFWSGQLVRKLFPRWWRIGSYLSLKPIRTLQQTAVREQRTQVSHILLRA